MKTDRPTVSPTGLYNQKQAAEALQVDRHTVARYEAAGMIRFRTRKAGKARVTTGAEIVRCWNSRYRDRL